MQEFSVLLYASLQNITVHQVGVANPYMYVCVCTCSLVLLTYYGQSLLNHLNFEPQSLLHKRKHPINST